MYIDNLGYLTKKAAMSIYGKTPAKTFKNRLVQNQKAYDFETWHEASGNGSTKFV